MINNDALCTLYEKNASTFGWETENISGNMPAGSTDMGNVSHVVPSIHPMFRIGSEAVNHTKEFTVASGTYAGLILGLRPANERRCYFVTASLIGWV